MYPSTTLNGPKKVNAIFKNQRSSGGKVGMSSNPSRNGRAITKSMVESETNNPFGRRSSMFRIPPAQQVFYAPRGVYGAANGSHYLCSNIFSNHTFVCSYNTKVVCILRLWSKNQSCTERFMLLSKGSTDSQVLPTFPNDLELSGSPPYWTSV